MVVLFTMKNDPRPTLPAPSPPTRWISLKVRREHRRLNAKQQFLRLRDRIEERAARKFRDVELEGNPPGVILRAIDVRAPR
jgi:hypothetical protein